MADAQHGTEDEQGRPAKRQRKPPAWKDKDYVDPTNLAAVLQQQQEEEEAEDEEEAAAAAGEGGEEGSQGELQLLEAVPLDPHTVEVMVQQGGRRYHGVMERTALPQGVGVPVPSGREELGSKSHGEGTSKLCALCNTSLDATPVQGISDDKAGLLAKVRITSNWTARVHLQCAVWCPECQEDPKYNNFYLYLGAAVRRGRMLRCAVCGERGSTLGCFAEGCPAVYHLPCAVTDGCMFNESSYEVWCPAHGNLAVKR